MGDLTHILNQIAAGDSSAHNQLYDLVYDELRRIAAGLLANEKPGQTLQPTALVNDLWLKIAAGNQQQVWNSKAHFFAAAAEAMRRILVDRARRKKTVKHGGDYIHKELVESEVATLAPSDEIIAVHEALDALAAHDPLAAQVIKLRYFGGYSLEEAADILGISRATAYRRWTYGRAWLRAKLDDRDSA